MSTRSLTRAVAIAIAGLLCAAAAHAQTTVLSREQVRALFTKPVRAVADTLQVSAPSIAKVTPQNQRGTPVHGAATVSVTPRDLLFSRTASTARLWRPREAVETAPLPAQTWRPENPKIRLPWEFVAVGADQKARRIVPYLQVENGGLWFSASQNRYKGQVSVGLIDELAPDAPAEQLAQNLVIQFSLTGPGEIAPPPTLTLDHTGIPLSPLAVSVAGTAQLRVQTQADLNGIYLTLPVRELAGTIRIEPDTVLVGFGLSHGRVHVDPPVEMAAGETLHVSLVGRPLEFDHSQITSPGGEASFRTGKPGKYVIAASAGGRPIDTAGVTVEWPWRHLVTMLLGAVLAGWARWTQIQGSRKIGALLGTAALASPFSLIGGLGGALGVDWFGWKLQAPGAYAAVLLVAAVTGWLGPKFLESLGEKKGG